MSLLVVYLVLIVAGTFVSYGVGLFIESVAPSFSLWAFLLMYFLSFAVCWYVAVKVTAPKTATA